MSEKKIFIMENHASAILAWFKLQQGSKCNLITFDEHTDTVAPLLRYKNSVLEGDEEALLQELSNMKNNLTEKLLREVLTDGVHLKSRKNRSWGEALRLWNDEHITTAIFFELIDKAYIVSPNKGDMVKNSKFEYLNKIYQRIFYLDSLFDKSKLLEIESFYEREIVGYQSCNLENAFIDKILNEIPENEDIILDIDLDYFKDMHVLENDLSTYSSFARLVRRCKGITIATEPSFVSGNTEFYNLNVIEKNEKSEKSEWIEGRYWNAQDCFEKLMTIIQASLDNKYI